MPCEWTDMKLTSARDRRLPDSAQSTSPLGSRLSHEKHIGHMIKEQLNVSPLFLDFYSLMKLTDANIAV